MNSAMNYGHQIPIYTESYNTQMEHDQHKFITGQDDGSDRSTKNFNNHNRNKKPGMDTFCNNSVPQHKPNDGASGMTADKGVFQSLPFGKFYCLASYVRHYASNHSTGEVAELMRISSSFINNEETPAEIFKICEFIGSRAPLLFRPLPNAEHLTLKDETEDKFIATPPMDYFMKTDVQSRNAVFMQMLKMYDVLIGRVKKNSTLDVLCFGNSKRLIIDDLLYEAVFDGPENANEGALIKGVVIDITIIAEKVLSVTTKMDILPEELKDSEVKLGLITEGDLPLHYRLYKNNDLKKQPLSSFLKIEEVHNKPGYKEELDFFKKNSSLRTFSRHIDRIPAPQEECASYIAAKRSKSMFMSKFNQAMYFIRHDKLEEALGMFQECLKIQPNDIASLLKCGVINLKLGGLEESIQNFENVLAVDRNNPKAKNFLSISLRRIIEKCETEKNHKNAIVYCKKLLKIGIRLQWVIQLLKYLLGFGSRFMLGPSWLMDKFQESTEVVRARNESTSVKIASSLTPASIVSPKTLVSCPELHEDTTCVSSAPSSARPPSASCAPPKSYAFQSRVLQHTGLLDTSSAGRNGLSSSVYKPPQKRKPSAHEVTHSVNQTDLTAPTPKRKPESSQRLEKTLRVYRSHSRRECPHHHGPKKQHHHHLPPSCCTGASCDSSSSGIDRREETSIKKRCYSNHESSERHYRSRHPSHSRLYRSRSRERSSSSGRSHSQHNIRMPWMSPTHRTYDAPVLSSEPYGPQPPPRYSTHVYRPSKIDPATGTSYFRESAQQAVSILHSCLNKVPEKDSQKEDKENK